MKVKVKFKVLLASGKITYKNVNYNCPNFEEVSSDFVLEGVPIDPYSVEQQVDNWVGELDKLNWMYQNDVEIIFDWRILSLLKESKQLVVKGVKLSEGELLEKFTDLPEMENLKEDFVATYLVMKSNLKGLSFKKKVSIVLGAVNVAYKSASNVYETLKNFEKSLSETLKDSTIKEQYEIFRTKKLV